MHTLFALVLSIRHSDPDVRRRGQNLVLLHSVLVPIALVFILIALSQPALRLSWPAASGLLLAFIAGALLARSGRITLSAWLLVGAWLVGVLLNFLLRGTINQNPLFLPCAILMAGLTMRPWAIATVLALALAILFLVFLPAAALPQPNATPTILVVIGGVLCLIAGLVALVGNFTGTRALKAAEQAQQQAEQAATERDRLNARLETLVQERTAALEQALRELEARATQQAALLEEVGLQPSVIRELNVPVLPVGKDTLVLPLIGALDSARLYHLQGRALDAVQTAGARRLILDVTGTPVIDSQVAQGLIVLVQGAKLLGAEVLLVGVRPEVAQTIVSLGLDITGVQTFRDLHAALDQVRPSGRLVSS